MNEPAEQGPVIVIDDDEPIPETPSKKRQLSLDELWAGATPSDKTPASHEKLQQSTSHNTEKSLSEF